MRTFPRLTISVTVWAEAPAVVMASPAQAARTNAADRNAFEAFIVVLPGPDLPAALLVRIVAFGRSFSVVGGWRVRARLLRAPRCCTARPTGAAEYCRRSSAACG